MNLSRRGTLLGASAIVASSAAVLFGCSTQTTSQLQTDAQTLAAGVQAIVADVQAIPGVTIPPATLAQIQAVASDVSTNAAAIASTLSPSTSVVQGISTAIATLGTLLTPFFPAAPLIAAAVSAAVTLASTLLSESGVSTAGAVMGAPMMTAAQARMVLKAAAAK